MAYSDLDDPKCHKGSAAHHQYHEALRMVALRCRWDESEEFLNLLRDLPLPKSDPPIEFKKAWAKELDLDLDNPTPKGKPQSTPADQWFKDKFPQHYHQWGYAIAESPLPHFQVQFPGYKADRINPEFFIGILMQNKALGHEMVFHQPSRQFYFYDPRTRSYHPTHEDKVRRVIVKLLSDCAREVQGNYDRESLRNVLSQDKVLRPIINQAKVILEVDDSYWGPDTGRCRFGESQKPCFDVVQNFVDASLENDPSVMLTHSEVAEAFREFCFSQGISSFDAQSLIAKIRPAIENTYGKHHRHDIPGPHGTKNRGWKGIRLRQRGDEDPIMWTQSEQMGDSVQIPTEENRGSCSIDAAHPFTPFKASSYAMPGPVRGVRAVRSVRESEPQSVKERIQSRWATASVPANHT